MDDVRTELDLVVKFRDAKLQRDALEEQLEKAQLEMDTAEDEIVEMLEAKNATKTAKYDSVGHITLMKPRLYCSVLKENESWLFDYLRDEGRGDLIKTVVNPQSLSGFIKETLESGKGGVPEKINYYFKASIRLYPDKK